MSLDAVLEDFGKLIDAATNVAQEKDKASEESSFDEMIAYIQALQGTRIIPEQGVVWWDATMGVREEMRFAGRPEDYAPIRDDFDALKKFIGTTLDRGAVSEYHGTHAPIVRDFSFAEYISWMYTFSQNAAFKANVERAVSELLVEEIDRDFDDSDVLVQRAKDMLADRIERYHDGDVLHAAGLLDVPEQRSTLYDSEHLLNMIGLGSVYGDIKLTPEEAGLRDYLHAEMEKTLRPETFEEFSQRHYARKLPDKQKKLEQEYRLHRLGSRNVIIPSELSDEAKEAYARRYLEWYPHVIAQRGSFTYDRLIGLLEVLTSAGRPDNGFAAAYDALLESVNEGRFSGMPQSFPAGGARSTNNIYEKTLTAIAAVQQGDDLADFWVGRVAGKNIEHAKIAVYGALGMPTRKTQLPRIFRKAARRSAREREELLDIVARAEHEGMYSRSTRDALDIIMQTETEPGTYRFTLERITASEVRQLQASYDVATGAIEGDQSAQGTIREYLKSERPLPGNLTITTLDLRRINGSAKIMQMDDAMKGSYEGILGILGTRFPLFYDGEQVLIGMPLGSSTYIFPSPKSSLSISWDNLEMPNGSVSRDSLVPFAQGQRALAPELQRVAKEKQLFASATLLRDTDFAALEPYVSLMVKAAAK